MRLLFLSRGTHLYSTQSLLRAARARGHNAHVIDFLNCEICVGIEPKLLYEGRSLGHVDAILPRVGASMTDQGAAVIRQFELMGVSTTVSSDALIRSRDKLRACQLLAGEGLQIPKTVFSHTNHDPESLIDSVGGLPIIIKLLQGTHGMGVVLVENRQTALAIIDAFQAARQRFIVQEYIRESKGADLRVLVVGGEVVAAMQRTPADGEFRANLHLGGEGHPVTLTPEQEEVAVRAARVMGLDVAGVDLLTSQRGPLVLEVNASPGLEGIETVTRVDVAGRIVEWMEVKGE